MRPGNLREILPSVAILVLARPTVLRTDWLPSLIGVTSHRQSWAMPGAGAQNGKGGPK